MGCMHTCDTECFLATMMSKRKKSYNMTLLSNGDYSRLLAVVGTHKHPCIKLRNTVRTYVHVRISFLIFTSHNTLKIIYTCILFRHATVRLALLHHASLKAETLTIYLLRQTTYVHNVHILCILNKYEYKSYLQN